MQTGETYDQAAKRELKEEIGLSVPIKHVQKITYVAGDHKRFMGVYIARADDGISFNDGEVAGGEFLDLDKAHELIQKGEKIHPQLEECYNWMYNNLDKC